MRLLFSFVFCCAEPVLTRTKLLSILNKGRRKHDHIEKRQTFFLRNNYWNNRVGKNVIYFLSRKKESDYDLSFKVTFFNTSNVHHVLAASPCFSSMINWKAVRIKGNIAIWQIDMRSIWYFPSQIWKLTKQTQWFTDVKAMLPPNSHDKQYTFFSRRTASFLLRLKKEEKIICDVFVWFVTISTV